MKKFLALVGLALLASCGPTPSSSDGYYFENSSFYHTNVQVEVVEVESLANLQEIARDKGVNVVEGRAVMAFSSINPANNKCKIYVVDPKTVYEPHWLGHEMMHCIHGQFHESQD